MPRPNPGIYELCLERLGVQPQESILLDSSSLNLKAAAQIGMKTVKVQSDTARVGFGFEQLRIFKWQWATLAKFLFQPVLVPAGYDGVKAGIFFPGNFVF